MNWKAMRARLEELWPRVATHDVMSVLQAGERWDQAVPAELAVLFSLEPPALATALMPVLVVDLPRRKPWDRIEVYSGLSALIRCGGDPTRVLPMLVEALEVERTREAAGSVLYVAALRGHDITSALDALAPHARTRHDGLRDAHTLAALQRAGHHQAIERVATVLQNHRAMGNLRGGLGLVEHQLLSERTDEVEQALVVLDALLEAGSDRQASWLALEPVIRTQLQSSDPFWQREAAQAAVQARHTLDRPAAALQRLDALVVVLADNLTHPDDSVAVQSSAALRVLTELGASLDAARAKVEAALLDPREAVRSAVSPALSTWLASQGLEEALPAGFSHRRTWAASDTPLEPEEEPRRCERCGQPEVVVIYRYHHRRQFGEDNRIETRCRSCGVYAIDEYGYDA